MHRFFLIYIDFSVVYRVFRKERKRFIKKIEAEWINLKIFKLHKASPFDNPLNRSAFYACFVESRLEFTWLLIYWCFYFMLSKNNCVNIKLNFKNFSRLLCKI
jgi:hypothetical protein